MTTVTTPRGAWLWLLCAVGGCTTSSYTGQLKATPTAAFPSTWEAEGTAPRPVAPPAAPPAAPVATSPQKTKATIVAVFDLEDASGKLGTKVIDQLTDYLSAKLTETTVFQVIPRGQLRQRLRVEKATSYRKCFDEACQIQLGKAVAAQMSLATKLLQVGNTCAITATLFDLRREITERAASTRTNCSENGLMDGMEKIAKQLGAARSAN